MLIVSFLMTNIYNLAVFRYVLLNIYMWDNIYII